MAGLQLLVALFACLLVLALPGALVGLAIRLSGLWLTAAAPVLSCAVIGLTVMVASFVGMPWSVWAVLVGAVIAAGLASVAARLFHAPRHQAVSRPGARWAPLVAVCVGVILMTLRTARAMPGADLFAQSFDNAFHLSAAKLIADTGAASPWDISSLLQPGGATFFYPSGWHALVALVAEVSGQSVVVASNACLIVITCTVWPLGTVLLSRAIFGDRPPMLIAAGVSSAAFASYPFALIASMGTYPLVASIALLPAAIAAAVRVTGIGTGFVSRRSAALLLIAIVPALATVHPSALVMLAVLSVPITIVFAVGLARRFPGRRRLIALTVTLWAAGVVALTLLLRTVIAQTDSLRSTVAQALGEVLFGAFGGMQIALVSAGLTIVGIVVAARRRSATDWIAIGLWATMAAIYIGTAGGDEFIRLVIGGPWYSDAGRIAAFTPVVVAPLMAAGAAACWKWFTTWVRRHRVGGRALRIVVTTTAVAAFAAAVLQSSAVREIDSFMRLTFTPTDNPLSSHVAVGNSERELIEYIARSVPTDDVIANNPRDASPFIYPLTGRHLLMPYMLSTLDDDRTEFYAGIADAAPTDPACEIARRLKVHWVVQFHPNQVITGDQRFNAMNVIEDSPNVELVHRVGESSLYRITGCGFDSN